VDQQLAWNAYARNYPRVDKLGSSFVLTGAQLYCACVSRLLDFNAALPTTAPRDNTVPVPKIVTFTVVHGSPATFDLVLGGGYPTFDTMAIGFSPPLPPGRRWVSAWWQGSYQGGNVTTVNGVTDRYFAQFGAVLLGWSVIARVTPVNAFGLSGPPVLATAVAT
jgi:hypothetical protein